MVIIMLTMSETSKQFLQKWLPDQVRQTNRRFLLLALYDLIMEKGFNEEDEYNAFGNEAQRVYDDIYYNNQ